MTATTIPHDLAPRSWNGLLKLAAGLTAAGALAAGSFAVGHTTADEAPIVVREAPAITTPIPSFDDLPSVQLRPSTHRAAESTCVPAAHRAPC